MRRVIILQARMTSTRLPGKILLEVAGRPMLVQQLRRLKECRLADCIVVATTTNTTDDKVVEVARQAGVDWFRGSEMDVLSRFAGAARQAQAGIVVRVTGDCPLIDPQVTDRVIQELSDHAATCDYAANILARTYPQGLDVEAFFGDVLQRVERMAQSPTAREHVTTLIYSEQPELFRRRNVADSRDNSDLRWTVDTAADLQVIRTIYEALDLGARLAPYPEILAYVRAHPEVAALNAGENTWQPVTKVS